MERTYGEDFLKKKQTVQIRNVLSGLSKDEISRIKDRCTAKRFDSGKLNNLMEGKGLHILEPIFILHVSPTEKKPKSTLEKMKEKICSIYLQSRKLAYHSVFIVSPSKFHALCLSTQNVPENVESVKNTYLTENHCDSQLLGKVLTELQELHALWVLQTIQKDFIKRALGKFPIKIFDNPKAYRNPFGQGTYTSASDNNQFALHFVYEEDFDKAVDLARKIMQQYPSLSLLQHLFWKAINILAITVQHCLVQIKNGYKD